MKHNKLSAQEFIEEFEKFLEENTNQTENVKRKSSSELLDDEFFSYHFYNKK